MKRNVTRETKPCHACRHAAYRSRDMGGMWVGVWGCLLKRTRFGTDADYKAGRGLPQVCSEQIDHATGR